MYIIYIIFIVIAAIGYSIFAAVKKTNKNSDKNTQNTYNVGFKSGGNTDNKIYQNKSRADAVFEEMMKLNEKKTKKDSAQVADEIFIGNDKGAVKQNSSVNVASKNTPGQLHVSYKPIEAKVKVHVHGGKEEKNIPVENSMGEPQSYQGCEEHYFSRFVTVANNDNASDKEKKEMLDEVRRAIVLGEIINKPAFRRRGGKIR